MPFNPDQLAQLADFGRNITAPDGQKTLDQLHRDRVEAAEKLRVQIAELKEEIGHIRNAAHDSGRATFAEARAEHLQLVERNQGKPWLTRELHREFERSAMDIQRSAYEYELARLGYIEKTAALRQLQSELAEIERQIEFDHRLDG